MADIEEKWLIYLKYKTVTEMLKVISSFGQPINGITPVLYLNEQVLFIFSSLRDGVIVNYTIITKDSAIELSDCELIELEEAHEELVNKSYWEKKNPDKKKSVNKSYKGEEQEGGIPEGLIAKKKKQPKSGTQLLYIPLIKVEKTSLKFPL